MLTGKHLIAGSWVGGTETFRSSPATGEAMAFAEASAAEVATACAAAEDAFAAYGATSREERALFLERIAAEIEARGDALTKTAMAETGLPAARLEGERGRTTGQLRLFASHIRDGAYLDRRVDPALPDRTPLPRPDIRLMQRPVGPIAVFGASNFPLAFSVAGGDTASALAAGCPVVVKGHPAHPGTCEIVAQAIAAAVSAQGLPDGVFNMVQGAGHGTGAALVSDPAIRAVGFTGSLAGGRALFDICARRDDPIPFFGELGSVNPMFVLPAALAQRATQIGEGWSGSLVMGAGQFCTNPGIAIVIEGPAADAFEQAAAEALRKVAAQTMLTDGIWSAYCDGSARLAATAGVREVISLPAEGRQALPALYAVSGKDWLENPGLAQEVFGPLGLIVRVSGGEEMLALAREMEGQLTATLHMDADDHPTAARLLPVLERKAGRLLANGFPTGVEVCDAMVHGGPYPASTNFGATSVGTMSIRRWLRPVCYQNIPQDLLPPDLQGL